MPKIRNILAIRALVIGVAALFAAGSAKACDERGCFGGVQGWGGLYRDNRDTGSFPIYVAVSGWNWGNVWVIERAPVLVYAPAPARAQAPTHRRATHARRHRRVILPTCAAPRPCPLCCG
jgi:hypothetical protein